MSELHRDETLSCQEIQQHLSARRSSEALADAVEAHLSGCTLCTDFQNAKSALDRQLAAILVVEPPTWLTTSILERVNPEKSVPWWARPHINLALQWSFYIALSGVLVLGSLLPIESATTWLQAILAIPTQLTVAFEVLVTVIGLVPLDTIASLFLDTSWLYELVALALVFWWLRQGTSASERRSTA